MGTSIVCRLARRSVYRAPFHAGLVTADRPVERSADAIRGRPLVQEGYVIHIAAVRYCHDDLNAMPTVMWCQFWR